MTGDLYELFDHAAGWRMPIRVRWINPANAEVTIAEIPLLKIQRKAIEDKLNAHGHQKDCKWFIPTKSLEKISNPADVDETNPERLVRWNHPDPGFSAHMNFVHAYCASRIAVVRNPNTFAPIWASIEKFMLQWLVTEGRPLKLSFGRFSACISNRGQWTIAFRQNRIFWAAADESKALVKRKQPQDSK